MCSSKCCDPVPAVCIELLFFWSYYVFVYEICYLLIDNLIKQIIYIIIINIFFILCQAMYFTTMCSYKWYVPNKYIFTPQFYSLLRSTNDYNEIFRLLVGFCRERDIHVYTRTSDGNLRFCSDCQLIKPDRAHHCNTCNTCVIRMDHHCPWVNNCVGFTNYKYFLIFVLYSAIYCTYYSVCAMEFTLEFRFTNETLRQLQIIIANFITIVIGILLWILLAYHLGLICKNQTTLEAMHSPTFGSSYMPTFNLLSRGDNFYEECGRNCLCWCLPVFTANGNGVDFEVIHIK